MRTGHSLARVTVTVPTVRCRTGEPAEAAEEGSRGNRIVYRMPSGREEGMKALLASFSTHLKGFLKDVFGINGAVVG